MFKLKSPIELYEKRSIIVETMNFEDVKVRAEKIFYTHPPNIILNEKYVNAFNRNREMIKYIAKISFVLFISIIGFKFIQ